MNQLFPLESQLKHMVQSELLHIQTCHCEQEVGGETLLSEVMINVFCAEEEPSQGPVTAPAENYFEFGDFPAGTYRVRWCDGAFKFTGGSGLKWTAQNWKTVPTYNGQEIFIDYFLDGTATETDFETGAQTYPDYESAVADAEAQGLNKVIIHSGGVIKMHMVDKPTFDNSYGDVQPTFGLYAVSP